MHYLTITLGIGYDSEFQAASTKLYALPSIDSKPNSSIMIIVG